MSKTVKIVLAIVLAIALVVGIVVFTTAQAEKKRIADATAAYNAGSYDEALALLREADALWFDAHLKAGEKALAEEDYDKALAHFEAIGDPKHDLWLQARCGQIMRGASPASYQETWIALQGLMADERNQEYVLNIQLDFLAELAPDESVPLAELEAMVKDLPVKEAEQLPGIHYTLATRWMEVEENYAISVNKAIDHYALSTDTATGEKLSALMSALGSRKFYESALMWKGEVYELSSKGYTLLGQHVTDRIKNSGPKTISEYLEHEKALRALSSGIQPVKTSSQVQEGLKNAYSSLNLGIQNSANYGTSYKQGQTIELADYNEIKAKAGTAANGKVLIVKREKVFDQDAYAYTIMLNLMEELPEEQYPASLEEVEYIIRITANYKRAGKYNKGTIAIRTTAKVELIKMPSGKVTYKSSTKTGGAPPSTIYYYFPPAFWSGSVPSVKSELVKAYKVVK